MVTALKLKGHKGIKEVKLKDLNHVNVICGKNNSGKTALVEAICNNKNCFPGIKITQESIPRIVSIFKLQADHYSSPHPTMAIPWFESTVKESIDETIFLDELEEIQKKNGQSFHKITSHGPDTFKFDKVYQAFINENVSGFKPVLIPPKRLLETSATLANLNDSETQDTIGVLNRLFVLSTKDNKTLESKIFQNIKNAFKEISNGCDFHISLEKQKIVIKLLNSQGDWIDADASGLGLRDVLVILSYLLDSVYTAIIIEEPESHLHPDMQRKLLKFIVDVKDKQIFLTTHSNIFLDSTYVNKVFYLEFKDGETRCSDATSRTNILTNLGYSVVDNLVSDLIVFTEGVLDIPVIKAICDKLGFLHKFSIKFYPLMGDIMHHLDLSLFTEKSKVMAIVDSDPGSKDIREEFIANCNKNNILVTRLQKYSTENYFSIRAIKKIYPFQEIPQGLTEFDSNKKVKTQLGFNVKSKSREIAQEMTLEEFEGTDLFNFCKNIHENLLKKS